MVLDSMPPGEDEEFPRLAEMEPPMAVDFPAHTSLWCKIRYFRERDHDPCPGGGCEGHGYAACGAVCLCYCH